MGLHGIFGYGAILQAIAIIHFIRRRPDLYWLFVIIFLGPLGALIYIALEMAPDAGLLRQSFRVYSHRPRIRELEHVILDNPSAGNLEELGDLYLEQEKYAKAKACYDRAISSRTDSPDPFYRRALCELELNQPQAAATDLERVVKTTPGYDYGRARGLLAYAWARSGRTEDALRLFAEVTETSTISETQVHYAMLLADLGRKDEARQWAERVLAKKATMPGFLRRRERPWFRSASALRKRVAA